MLQEYSCNVDRLIQEKLSPQVDMDSMMNDALSSDGYINSEVMLTLLERNLASIEEFLNASRPCLEYLDKLLVFID